MITYIYDETVTHRPEIVKHLIAYNIVFTGERPSEERHFYVLQNNILVGAVTANLGWDWITLDKIYYERFDVLEELITAVLTYFKGKANGILYVGEISNRLDDFYKTGFARDGIIDATKQVKEVHCLSNTTFDRKSNDRLETIDIKEINQTFDLIHQTKIKKDIKKDNIIIIAKEGDTIVGGIHGEILFDKMYISLLVVLETHRGQQIGMQLMEQIETAAIKKGIISIDLGTCEFQALDFYKKMGYNVVATLQNYPKGFEEYTLVKRLDK